MLGKPSRTTRVRQSKRYDPDADTRGGNTKLVVDRDRRVREQSAVLGGTHTTAPAG